MSKERFVRFEARRHDYHDWDWRSVDEMVNPQQVFRAKKFELPVSHSVPYGEEETTTDDVTAITAAVLRLLKLPVPTKIVTEQKYKITNKNHYGIQLHFAFSEGGGHNGHAAYSRGPSIKTDEYLFKTKKHRDAVYREITND